MDGKNFWWSQPPSIFLQFRQQWHTIWLTLPQTAPTRRQPWSASCVGCRPGRTGGQNSMSGRTPIARDPEQSRPSSLPQSVASNENLQQTMHCPTLVPFPRVPRPRLLASRIVLKRCLQSRWISIAHLKNFIVVALYVFGETHFRKLNQKEEHCTHLIAGHTNVRVQRSNIFLYCWWICQRASTCTCVDYKSWPWFTGWLLIDMIACDACIELRHCSGCVQHFYREYHDDLIIKFMNGDLSIGSITKDESIKTKWKKKREIFPLNLYQLEGRR